MHFKCNAWALIPLTLTVMIPAAASAKIDYVRIDDDASSTPVIEVFQSEDQDGNLRYSTIKPAPLDVIYIGVEIEGRCQVGYRLSRVLLKNDNEGNCVEASGTAYCGTGDTDPAYEPVVSLPVVEQDVVFTPGNRTLGKRVEYFELPTESFQPVIDWGNESVASRAGSIQQEQVIRSSDWSVYLWQPIGLKVRCAHVAGYTGLKAWWGNATFEKPIRVVFRGKSAAFDLNSPAPGQGVYFDPSLPNGQLADEVRVEPYLLIVDDFDDGASNDCKLNLSGTFKTNGETVVFYRIVDDRGEMSPLYKVAVDQTYTAFVYHPVDLSEREPEAPQPGINRGFSAIPTDRLQGFYEIRVVSPYKTVSNVASFNLEPCKTRPDTIHSILGG